MKIEFESRGEIRSICKLLQEIYPAAICVTAEDLDDVCGNDCKLPWDSDGFHPTLKVTHTPKAERLYTHREVFGQGQVWEEVEQDGKTYLRAVTSASTPFIKEESMIFLAGQVDAWFRLVEAGKCTIPDMADLTGQMEQYLVDLCRIWGRRYSVDTDAYGGWPMLVNIIGTFLLCALLGKISYKIVGGGGNWFHCAFIGAAGYEISQIILDLIGLLSIGIGWTFAASIACSCLLILLLQWVRRMLAVRHLPPEDSA